MDEANFNDSEIEEGIDDTFDWDNAELIEDKDKDNSGKKYYVDDVDVEVVDVHVQYLDENGNLITENIKEFCKKFMLKRFPDITDFVNVWKQENNKLKYLNKLSTEGLFLDELRKEYGKEFDLYDIILNNTYGVEPLTREQRANKANYILNQLEGDCLNIFNDIMKNILI